MAARAARRASARGRDAEPRPRTRPARTQVACGLAASYAIVDASSDTPEGRKARAAIDSGRWKTYDAQPDADTAAAKAAAGGGGAAAGGGAAGKRPAAAAAAGAAKKSKK